MDPKAILGRFDAFLAQRGQRLDAVVIGGTALNLLGVVSRPTKDCDILHPHLPESIVSAARAFAQAMRSQGEQLQDDWLNNGPESLVNQLPVGWDLRLQDAFVGAAMKLTSLGGEDLLRSKLFALCDRALDLLIALHWRRPPLRSTYSGRGWSSRI